jgi:hypothetical protein
MKEISISKGYVALVDDEDFEWLSERPWSAQVHKYSVYAVSNTLGSTSTRKRLRMHRLLVPWAKFVDHKDGNGLNNQKYNLRPCTWAQNMQNKRPSGMSGLKGVSWRQRDKLWVAIIKVEGKVLYLGCGKDKYEVASKYDTAATKYFGEFALTNTMLMSRQQSVGVQN